MKKVSKEETIVDVTKLLESTNAAVWAKEFCKLNDVDEGVMIAWFANAIETAKTITQREFERNQNNVQTN